MSTHRDDNVSREFARKLLINILSCFVIAIQRLEPDYQYVGSTNCSPRDKQVRVLLHFIFPKPIYSTLSDTAQYIAILIFRGSYRVRFLGQQAGKANEIYLSIPINYWKLLSDKSRQNPQIHLSKITL
jgi:hypothetical protein